MAVALAGCLQGPPAVRVVNETEEAVAGTARLYYEPSATGDPARLTDLRKTWTFDAPGNATTDLGRLPRWRVEYHWLVVELEDGRSDALAVHNGDHFLPVFVTIRDDAVEIRPQSVRERDDPGITCRGRHGRSCRNEGPRRLPSTWSAARRPSYLRRRNIAATPTLPSAASAMPMAPPKNGTAVTLTVGHSPDSRGPWVAVTR